jgi:NADH dehydrogenase FAD-containing subunit
MKKHLIFAGGGHAHIHSLVNLDKFSDTGTEVTVVSRTRYHYYSGMGPGLLSGYYNIDEARFDLKGIVESAGCKFIEMEVNRIVPSEKKIILSDNSELFYDFISFNTGSDAISLPVSGNVINLYPVKPIENITLIRDRITQEKKNLKIAIVGGGAAGVEVAANLNELVVKNKVNSEISIISRDHLLPGYTEPFYSKILDMLQLKGIKIYEYKNVELIEPENIVFTSGDKLKYDLAVNASGITPSRIFTHSGMKTGADGGLSVNKYLQSSEYTEIFAGGDCINFEPAHLNKVGVYAVREGMLLYRNLLDCIKGCELEEFKPQKDYLSILNMGFKQGVMLWKGKVFSGRIPFYFKYYLDSRFMKKYQNRGRIKK